MKIYLAMGSINNTRIKIFKEEGVQRILVSYAELQGSIPELPFPDIILDSGAYGIGHSAKQVSIKAYSLWLQLYLNKYSIVAYANFDNMLSPEESQQNLEYLESEGLYPMPVYHYGEPLDVLDKMCGKYEYIGLGGLSIGMISTEKLRNFWEYIYERYKDNKFHIFGSTQMGAFINYQPFSLDSSSWTLGSRFGIFCGYRNELPALIPMREKEGIQLFFTAYEGYRNNIRAMLDWEKLEWLKNVNKDESKQARLL